MSENNMSDEDGHFGLCHGHEAFVREKLYARTGSAENSFQKWLGFARFAKLHLVQYTCGRGIPLRMRAPD